MFPRQYITRTIGVLAVLLSCALVQGEAGAALKRTTIPSGDEFRTVTGVNNQNNTATWKVGGHITYNKQQTMTPGIYAYGFTGHTNSVCGNSYCAEMTGKAYILIEALTGAGTTDDDPKIPVFFDQRVYKGDNLHHSRAGGLEPGNLEHILTRNGYKYEYNFSFGSIGGTSATVQYKVGAWQGETTPWSSSGVAATPGL
jgi:hypothetical protein